MTTTVDSAGSTVLTPDEGMRLVDAEGTVAEGSVTLGAGASASSWSEVTEAEAAEIEAMNEPGATMPESFMATDGDSVGDVKEKMNKVIRFVNSKQRARS